MDSIDSRTLRDAGSYVDECKQYADIHTVTLTINGGHGGVDVVIEGLDPAGDNFKRTFQVPR